MTRPLDATLITAAAAPIPTASTPVATTATSVSNTDPIRTHFSRRAFVYIRSGIAMRARWNVVAHASPVGIRRTIHARRTGGASRVLHFRRGHHLRRETAQTVGAYR